MMRRLRTSTCTLLWTAVLAAFALPANGQDVTELALGSSIPEGGLTLDKAGGGQSSLSGLQGEVATVVMFWSNQCPWVEKYEERAMSLVEDFAGQGVSFVLVNSNDSEAYPRESVQASTERVQGSGYPSSVAYLDDPTSRLAMAFGAERTPHVYVFDSTGKLAYVGTIDDSPGDPDNVKAHYLRDALTAVVGAAAVPMPTTKAFGCTIKFKS